MNESAPSLLAAARDALRAGAADEAERSLRALLEAPDGGPAEAFIQLGRILRQRGDRAGAVAWFERGLTAHPADLQLRSDLANDLRQIGRLDEADALLVEILAREPDHPSATLQRGRIARDRGDRAAALRLFEEAARRAPGSPVAARERAAELLALGRAGEADALLAEIVARDPANAAALLDRARIARLGGDRRAALALSQRAAAAPNAPPVAAIEAANDHAALGEPDAARALYERALVDAPEDANALLGLARLERSAGRRAEAVQLYERGVAAHPRHSALLADLSVELRLAGRLDEADDILARTLAADPARTWTLVERGRIARAKGDRVAAMAFFEAALAADPPASAAPAECAAEYLAHGRHDDAERVWLAEIRRDPAAAAAHSGLGRLYFLLGRTAAACACFEAAIACDRKAAAPRFDYASHLRMLGWNDRARRQLDTLLAVQPGNVVALMQLAALARLDGELEEAAGLFERALRLDPASPAPLVEIADCRFRAGDPAGYAAALRRAFDLDPHAPAVVMAIVRLLGQLEQHALLERYLEAMIEAHPSLITLHMRLSALRADVADYDGALAVLDKADAAVGANAYLLLYRARVFEAAGRFDIAADLLRARAGGFPGFAAADIEIAECLANLGRTEEAKAVLDRIGTDQVATEARRHSIHGKIALESADFAAAKVRFEAVLAIEPDNENALTNLCQFGIVDLDVESARRFLLARVRLQYPAKVLRRVSANPSQGEYGQILNEFMIDPGLIAGIRALRQAPAARAEDGLRRLVLAHPGALAPAQEYTVRVLPTGSWRPDPAAPERPAPRRIIQFWNTPEPPPAVVTMMDSWRAAPGFEHRLFDDATARGFLREHLDSRYERAFRLAGQPARKADLFRLCALFVLGGYYVDADDVRIGSIDDVVPATAELVLYREGWGHIGNNFMAARPGHPMIAIAMERVRDAILADDSDSTWLCTGPGLVTRALAAWLAGRGARAGQGQPGLTLLTRGQLRRLLALSRGLPHKRTAAHWKSQAADALGPELAWLMTVVTE